MALSTVQQPAFHQPAHNPLNYVYNSDQSGLINFRYFTEVFVNSVKRAEFFDIPRPDGGRLWKDIHRVVEPYVYSNAGLLYTPLTGVQFDPQYVEYNVRVTEYVGSVSGDVLTSQLRLANNMAQSWVDYIGNDFNSYVISASGGLLRTERQKIKIARSEIYMISWITGVVDAVRSFVNRIQIIPFNASGDLTAINYVDANQGSGNIANRYKRILVGFDLCSIPSNATGFRVVAQGQSNNNLSQVITFTLTDECIKDTSARVFYLNRLGNFDAYTFNANPIFRTNIERETYKRILGSVKNSGYVYDASQHRELPMYTKYTDNIELRSQWLTDEESRAMDEVSTSPKAFIQFGSGAIIPINILADSYQRKYRQSNKMFDATMQVKLSYDNQTQRR